MEKFYLLEGGVRQWTAPPPGVAFEDGHPYVYDTHLADDWIKSFVLQDGEKDGEIDIANPKFWDAAERNQNPHGWPWVYVQWRPQFLFTTPRNAEAYAQEFSYRWDDWRVVQVTVKG
jgi:hypothetical protein